MTRITKDKAGRLATQIVRDIYKGKFNELEKDGLLLWRQAKKEITPKIILDMLESMPEIESYLKSTNSLNLTNKKTGKCTYVYSNLMGISEETKVYTNFSDKAEVKEALYERIINHKAKVKEINREYITKRSALEAEIRSYTTFKALRKAISGIGSYIDQYEVEKKKNLPATKPISIDKLMKSL